MRQLIEDIKNLGFLEDDEITLRELVIRDEMDQGEDEKEYIATEAEVSTGFFDQINLLGKNLDQHTKFFFEKSRDFAAKLVLNFIQGKLGDVHDLAQYQSRKLRDCENFFDIDIDSTIENFLDDPRTITPWVFERKKSRNPVVLLVDTSYSMNGEKLLIAALAVGTLAKLVDNKDLSIISFNDKITMVKKFEDNLSGISLLNRVLSFTPQGYTDLFRGLEFGGRLVAPFLPYSRLIVLTDADPTRGKNPLTAAGKLYQLDVLLFPMGNKWLGEQLSSEAQYGQTINLERPEDVPDALKEIFSS